MSKENLLAVPSLHNSENISAEELADRNEKDIAKTQELNRFQTQCSLNLSRAEPGRVKAIAEMLTHNMSPDEIRMLANENARIVANISGQSRPFALAESAPMPQFVALYFWNGKPIEPEETKAAAGLLLACNS